MRTADVRIAFRSGDGTGTVSATMRWAVLCTALGACGRINFDIATFTTPELVTALESNLNDRSPSATDDLLELCYQSNLGGATRGTIRCSLRASTTDPWPASVAVVELTSGVFDRGPSISGDGLTLWLSSERTTGKLEIHIATRALRTDHHAIADRVII